MARTSLSVVGNLIKILPSGTLFLFLFLSPLLTNYGTCPTTANKIATAVLLAICAFACCFSAFTDSCKDSSTGRIHYGIVTSSGMCLFDLDRSSSSSSSRWNLSGYKLCFGDFVHAALALLVFSLLALLLPNIVTCYYSSLVSKQKTILVAAPVLVAAICSTAAAYFPCKRHGIGHLPPEDSSSSSPSYTLIGGVE
ncbi:hypothetical protein ACLOJK_025883 [Asimina triloba]